MLFWVIIAAIILGLLPAYIARSKGRNFVTWWIYGALLFIVALPHSVFLGEYGMSGTKKCGYCKKSVDINAAYCKHCGYDFTTMGF